jgi:hypothetical protein
MFPQQALTLEISDQKSSFGSHYFHILLQAVPTENSFTNVQVCDQMLALLASNSAAAQRGPWPPHSRGFLITHNDAPQSVGLLWTSDQLVAETST